MLYGNAKDGFEQLLDTWGDKDFETEEDEVDQLNEVIDELTSDNSDSFNISKEGLDEDSLQSILSCCQVPEVINADELKRIRMYGPLGRLQNIGVAMRTSSH
jgi:hypothetical protein